MSVYAPTFEVVNRIRQELEDLGSKLSSDGRPTIGGLGTGIDCTFTIDR